jgi:chemotaxis protein methyltransferase CheR
MAPRGIGSPTLPPTLALRNGQAFQLMLYSTDRIEDAETLAQAIVNTIPEPFLVLDDSFHVLAASRSFYETFKVDPEQTRGCLLYALGDGQWDIPSLRLLLETIIPEQASMDGFEVEHDFPGIGCRTMLLNARKVLYQDSPNTTILLAFSDVTVRRAIEREKQDLLERTEELLRQKQVLLQEMEHRVANSLSIIASILMLKARAVTSEETRQHLQDAHQRVMSVAEVQSQLHASEGIDRIEVGTYLLKLCEALASSMIVDQHPIAVEVEADAGTVSSARAVSLGLIVTELVINAIKYAFPSHKADARILVTYAVDEAAWKLVVADNGIGKEPDQAPRAGGGLGTTIVKALAQQLGAGVETQTGEAGLKISVAGTASLHLPLAA